MAYFKINKPNQPIKYIKGIDGANGTLEFTDKIKEALYRDDGFFANSEYEFVKFHFKEKYPELEYLTLVSEWDVERNNLVQAAEEGLGLVGVEQIALDVPAPNGRF